MACPEKTEIEELVASSLAEEDRKRVIAHLATCAGCRREAAFLTAVRLSMPRSSPGPDCLSDESMAWLRDGALPEEEHSKTLRHLAGCERCLGALVSLDRALREATRDPVAPPERLLKKAVARGAPPTKPAWPLGMLLSPSPILRLGLALALAASVFLLVVLLSPGPQETTPTEESQKDLLAEVQTEQKAPSVTSSEESEKEAALTETPVDQPAPIILAVKPPAPDDTGKAADFLDELSEKERLQLLAQVDRALGQPKVELAQGLNPESPSILVYQGFRLGEALGTLLDFSKHIGDSPKVRVQLGSALQSAGTLLRSLLPKDEKLSGFADGLGKQLQQGALPADLAMRRLQVLATAVEEALLAHPDAETGYGLGRFTSTLVLLASAMELGYPVPAQAWISPKAISRVRGLLERSRDLSDEKKLELINNIDRIEKMGTGSSDRTKAQMVLEELRQLDRNVRASR